MAAKHFLAILGLTLLAPACLRLMDEPPEEGAAGFECWDSDDCEPGRFCLGTDRGVKKGHCGEPGECEGERSVCGPGSACLGGRCTPVECSGSFKEPETVCGTYQCDDAMFKCKTSCNTSGDCSGSNVCRSGGCYADVCTTANAALICEGNACDTVLGKCYSPGSGVCRDHGCATGHTCVDGSRCEKTCVLGQTSPQCGDYKCISTTRGFPEVTYTYCATSCDAHTDCLNGKVCIDRKCALKPQP
jgi:hypothetical protein